jgi:hypothetical protein
MLRGTGVGLANEVLPAGKIVADTQNEAKAVLSRLQAAFGTA